MQAEVVCEFENHERNCLVYCFSSTTLFNALVLLYYCNVRDNLINELLFDIHFYETTLLLRHVVRGHAGQSKHS